MNTKNPNADPLFTAGKAAVEAALAADREAALRDAFAGGALSAIIANQHFSSDDHTLEGDRMRAQVCEAYEYADLMMLARKGQL